MRRTVAMRFATAALVSVAAACAGQSAEMPAYVPTPLQAGVIRSWGDDSMRGTMTAWEQTFRIYHPDIRFSDTLRGTATSMAGIITGVSDMSLMGRPVTVNEVIGFEWIHRTKPLGFQVMNGGLGGEGKSPSLAVFVAARNPLQQISLKQLEVILGCPTATRSRITWALAGARGAWANKPVHAYLYDDQTGTGAFLQRAIEGSRDCWNWDVVHEFKDKPRADGTVDPAGRQISEALEHDPDGVAITTLNYASPKMKALEVAGTGSAQPLAPATVIDGSYPLARGVYIYINREKNKPVDARVAEFLRFVLSREGQALVQQQKDYLPLNAASTIEQRKKLE